jgi:hypothetical protein
VAVALGHHVAVDLVGQRAGLDVGALRAQAHRAAQVGLACASGSLPSRSCHSSISAITGCGAAGSNSVLLAPFQPGHVARVLDGGHLHAQADAQVGHACSRAYCAATILPSMPRLPKPPGTRMASNCASC